MPYPNLFPVYQIEAYSSPSFCLSPMSALLLNAANCVAARPPGHPAAWRPRPAGHSALHPPDPATRPPAYPAARLFDRPATWPPGPARWRGPVLAPALRGCPLPELVFPIFLDCPARRNGKHECCPALGKLVGGLGGHRPACSWLSFFCVRDGILNFPSLLSQWLG